MAVYNIIQRSTIKEGNNILAEHYQKERMENENLLKKVSSYKIKHYFKENTETINPVLLNSDWRVFDLTDSISQFLIGGINPEEVEVSSNKKIAQPSSFIISRLRHYLKEMAIVPTISEKIALSTEYLVFKSKSNVAPHLLLVFSLTKYVQTILDWAQTGNAHPRFSSITFKNIYLPDILVERSNIYQSVIDESIELLNKSNRIFDEASDLFNNAIGLNNVYFKKKKSFSSSLKKLVESKRIDPDHFRPKFEKLINHIENNFKCFHVGTSVILNRRGVQPIYIENGLFKVVTSQHITETHLDYYNFDRTSEKYFSASPLAQIKYGDILTYTTGAYVGKTNVYLSKEHALASNHVNIMRLKNTEVDPVYVSFVMNSIVGKMQTEKHIRGSAQAELYPNDIAKFIIPILDTEIMDSISKMVKESLFAQRKSKELLDQAIEEVESLIQKAAERL